jgi:hypothetical protein
MSRKPKGSIDKQTGDHMLLVCLGILKETVVWLSPTPLSDKEAIARATKESEEVRRRYERQFPRDGKSFYIDKFFVLTLDHAANLVKGITEPVPDHAETQIEHYQRRFQTCTRILEDAVDYTSELLTEEERREAVQKELDSVFGRCVGNRGPDATAHVKELFTATLRRALEIMEKTHE